MVLESFMKQAAGKLWREYRGFTLFIVLMVVFRSAVADWNSVPTGSMKPTIVEGDRILVNKHAYDVRVPLTAISLYKVADPKHGEIVVFDSKVADTRLVKRVIGLPGDVIELRANRLRINGIDATYVDVAHLKGALYATESFAGMSRRIQLSPFGSSPLSSFGPVRVPKGHYFVMGDNRDNSADSRVHGFVPRAEIVGNAKTVVMSLDYERHYLPRGDRFFRTL